MTNLNAEMGKKNSESASQEGALDRRYGRIGISAVAAAARYLGDKKPAHAPEAKNGDDRRGGEAA